MIWMVSLALPATLRGFLSLLFFNPYLANIPLSVAPLSVSRSLSESWWPVCFIYAACLGHILPPLFTVFLCILSLSLSHSLSLMHLPHFLPVFRSLSLSLLQLFHSILFFSSLSRSLFYLFTVFISYVIFSLSRLGLLSVT